MVIEMRRLTVIFNPNAGVGRFKVDEPVLKKEIFRAARERDIDIDLEIRRTSSKGDCQDIAAEAESSGVDVVAVAGGDGTVMEAVNCLRGSDTMLGIIPIGSGNDDIVSISGHASRERCIGEVLTGGPHTLDTGIMNDLLFLNVVGIGLDAEINHTVARKREMVKRMGPALTYGLAAFKVLLFYKPYVLEIKMDGRDLGQHSVSLCTIGNGTTCGGGFKLTPRAIMDDGMLDLSLSGYLGKIRSISNIKTAFEGKHLYLPDNIYSRFRKIEILSDVELPYHIDGEAGFAEKISIEVSPSSIVTVHPHIGSYLE